MYQYALDDIIKGDKYLRGQRAKEILAKAILQDTYKEGDVFPSKIVRDKCTHLLGRVRRCISSLKYGGFGLKTRVAGKKGEVMGIYGGPVVADPNPYTIEVKPGLLVGAAPSVDPWSVYGYINDYIWDLSKQNCTLHDCGGGVFLIVLTQDIEAGKELYMSYGRQYDWSTVKARMEEGLLDLLYAARKELLKGQGYTCPSTDDIRGFWKNRSHPGHPLANLCRAFYAGDDSEPHQGLTLHRSKPQTGLTVAAWVESVLTCSNFYYRCCFRVLKPGISVDFTGCFSAIETYESSSKRPQRGVRVNYCEDITGMLELPTPQERRWLSEQHLLDWDRDYQNQTTAQATPPAQNTLEGEAPGTKPPCESRGPEDSLLGQGRPTPVPSSHSHSVRMMSYNVNGLDEAKLRMVCDWIGTYSFDVAVLVDIKLSTGHPLLRRATVLIGKGFRCFSHVDPSLRNIPSVDKRGWVGGTLYIVGPRLSHVKIHRTCHLATTSYIQCRFGHEPLHIAGVYWPNKNDKGTTTWWQRVKQAYGMPTPEACKALLGGIVDETVDAQATLLVGGDFNSDLQKKDLYGLADVERAWLLQHSSTTEERKPSSYGFTETRTSRIDYQFFRGPAVLSASCKVVELDEVVHDHRPLFGEYHMRAAVHHVKPMKMRLHNDVDVRNTPKVDHLKEVLEKFDLRGLEGLPPAEQLRKISDFTVKQARRLFDKPRRSKNGWSPTTRANTICLKHLVLMKRHAFGSHRYSRWTSSTYGAGMGLVRRSWRRDLWALARKKPDEYYGLMNENPTAYGFFHWFSEENPLSLETLREVIPSAIKKVRNRLHQKKCSDIRAEYNERMRKIEEKAKKGQIRYLIRESLGGKRHHVSWEDLEQDGVVHTDPQVIHDKITDSFKEWFKAERALPAYSTEWKDQILSWEGFQTSFADIPVPIDMKRRIWAALSRRCPRLEEAEALLSSPILYEDFESAIKSAPTDSAAGMSGLSYNMIKQWPKPLKIAAYNALAKIWEDKSIPFEWRWRWVVPIPKVPNPSIQDFRPIALLEVLRKLWLGITVDRLQRLWSTPGESMLCGSQYGFLRGRSTEEAVLEVVNVFETAKEWRSELYVSSWDIKRAFDRVPKALLILAWIRMGVPECIAKYIVGLDIMGFSVVRTPLAQHKFDKLGHLGIRALAFLAELGCSQGDKPSPLNWNAFFDILLTALLEDDEDTFIVPDQHGFNRRVGDIAFADDLISVVTSIASLQRRADMVSAFCALFRMNIATGKLRAFHLSWGNQDVPGGDQLIIHDHQWHPTVVPLHRNGIMKHLGVQYEMEYSSDHQFGDLCQRVRAASLRIQRKRKFSAGSKWVVMVKSVYESVRYVGKLAAWPLAKYLEIDDIVSNFLRKITKNMASFPTALLYLKAADGGLGFVRFSDRAQASKLSFFRRFDTGHRGDATVSGLLSRGLHDMGAYCPPRAKCILKQSIWKKDKVWWITSLIDWLDQQELSLRVNGYTLTRAMSLLADLPDWAISLQSRQGAMVRGISMCGELNPGLVGSTHDGLAVLVLRAGQCWTGLSAAEIRCNDVVEIAGFLPGDRMEVLLWVNPKVAELAEVGDEVAVFAKELGHPSGFPTGSGTKLTVAWRPLFRNGRGKFYHVLLSPEQHYGLPVAVNTCKVGAVTLKYVSFAPFTWQYRPECDQEVWDFCEDAKFLYVDGSYRNECSTCDMLNGDTTSSTAGAAVVKVTEGDQVEILRINGHQEYNSVFLLELQALLLCRISAPNTAMVFSDSEAAIATTKEGYQSGNGPQAQFINGMHKQAAPVQWIKAHVPREEWGKHHWGNDLADRMAKGETTLEDYDPEISRYIEVNDTQLLADLAAASMVTVVDRIDRAPTVSLDIRRSQWDASRYVRTRDGKRADRRVDCEAKWGGVTRRWAASIWRLPSIHLSKKAAACRIIWDKNWTLRNQWIHAELPWEMSGCRLCKDGMEDQDHIIRGCTHPAVRVCRRKHVARIRIAIQDAIKSGEVLGRLMETYFELATSAPDGYMAWTGMLSPALQIALEKTRPKLNESERGRFVRYGILYADAVLELYTIRQGLLAGLPTVPAPAPKRTRDGEVLPQITRYFTAAAKPHLTREGILRVPFLDFDQDFKVSVDKPRTARGGKGQKSWHMDTARIVKRGALLGEFNQVCGCNGKTGTAPGQGQDIGWLLERGRTTGEERRTVGMAIGRCSKCDLMYTAGDSSTPASPAGLPDREPRTGEG